MCFWNTSGDVIVIASALSTRARRFRSRKVAINVPTREAKAKTILYNIGIEFGKVLDGGINFKRDK